MPIFPFAKSRPAAIDWEAPDAPVFVWSVLQEADGIREGTRLTVRESLCAAVVAQGRVADVFGPGSHELTAERLPGLSRILGWGSNPPAVFAASLFYVQMKAFRDLPWSVDAPVGIPDGSGGKITVRADGSYSVKVADASRLLGHIFGSNRIHESEYLLARQRSWLGRALAETCREVCGAGGELALSTDELAARVEQRMRGPFAGMGLELSDVRIADFVISTEGGPEASAAGNGRIGRGRVEAADLHFAGETVQVTEEERLLLVSGAQPKRRFFI